MCVRGWTGKAKRHRIERLSSLATERKCKASCKRQKKIREEKNENKAIIALVPHSAAVAALSPAAAAAATPATAAAATTVWARFHSCCHVALIFSFFFTFLCKSSLPFWCYLAVWPTMGVAVISRNYAYPQRSCSNGESETDDDDDVVCEMNDKPTCSGFKKYGNSAAARTYTLAYICAMPGSMLQFLCRLWLNCVRVEEKARRGAVESHGSPINFWCSKRDYNTLHRTILNVNCDCSSMKTQFSKLNRIGFDCVFFLSKYAYYY